MPIDTNDQDSANEEYEQSTLQMSQLLVIDQDIITEDYDQHILKTQDQGSTIEECCQSTSQGLKFVSNEESTFETCYQITPQLPKLSITDQNSTTEECDQSVSDQPKLSANDENSITEECDQPVQNLPKLSVNDENSITEECDQTMIQIVELPVNDQVPSDEQCNEISPQVPLLSLDDQENITEECNQNIPQISQLSVKDKANTVEEMDKNMLEMPQLSVNDQGPVDEECHKNRQKSIIDQTTNIEDNYQNTLEVPQLSVNDLSATTEKHNDKTHLQVPQLSINDRVVVTDEDDQSILEAPQLSINDQDSASDEYDPNTLQIPQLSINDFNLSFDDEDLTDSRSMLSSSDQSESSECLSPRKRSLARRRRCRSTSDINNEDSMRLTVNTSLKAQRLGSASSSPSLDKINSDMVFLDINNESGSDSTSRASTPSTSEPSRKRKRRKRIRSLKASLFPNVPPTVHFAIPSEKIVQLPTELNSALQWKLSSITPYLVKEIVTRSGFTLTKDDHFWTSTWGRYITCQQFKFIKENQKVNHFPGSFNLGRKDKLWLNIRRMQSIHGEEKFGFMPETYILPHELKLLRATWVEEGARRRWIIKPPASSKGIGVSVVHRWCDIPKTEAAIAQKYISRPYLINDTKFDLRLYVLVTSFDPLRIYLFNDGLVRFASVKYTRDVKFLSEKFIHLTNYSINRNNVSYTSNDDADACQGHKWTLKSLWVYFREIGVDDKKLLSSLTDVVIKTIISCEDPVNKLVRVHARNRYNCYELFGFDIMLDSELRPWLLEVNISPSLHSNSLLDSNVKSQLIKDMFNTVGFHIPEEVKLNSDTQLQVLRNAGIQPQKVICLNTYLYRLTVTPEERMKQLRFEMNGYNESILRDLSPSDIRQLVQSEDELARCGHFKRIFPSENSYVYLEYFERQKYYNLLLDAWERRYNKDRTKGIQLLQSLCEAGVHMQFDSSFVRASRLKSLKTNIKTALSKVGNNNSSFNSNSSKSKNGISPQKEYFENYKNRENGRMGILPPLIQEKFNVASCAVGTNCSMI